MMKKRMKYIATIVLAFILVFLTQQPLTASAIITDQQEDTAGEFIMRWTDRTKMIPESPQQGVSKFPGYDDTPYPRFSPENARVRYTHIGHSDQGDDLDVIIDVKGGQGVTGISFSQDHLMIGQEEFDLSDKNANNMLVTSPNPFKRSTMTMTFVKTGTNTPYDFGGQSVGLLVSDLEPAVINVDGKLFQSFNQAVVPQTKLLSVTGPAYQTTNNRVQISESTRFPRKYLTHASDKNGTTRRGNDAFLYGETEADIEDTWEGNLAVLHFGPIHTQPLRMFVEGEAVWRDQFFFYLQSKDETTPDTPPEKWEYTINFRDFDHPKRLLTSSEIGRVDGGNDQVTINLKHEITSNKNTPKTNKTYRLVAGKNNGKENNNRTMVIDKNHKTVDLYYRTKWHYDLIHQVQGTNPSPADKTNPNGPLLKVDSGEFYYKTDDGKHVNEIGIGPRTDLKNDKGQLWIPREPGKVVQVKENDQNNVLRLNYAPWEITAGVDWFMLDTQKADTNKIPMNMRVHFNSSLGDSRNVLSTSGIQGNSKVANDARNKTNEANRFIKNLAKNTTFNITVDNQTTGTKAVYTVKDRKVFEGAPSQDKKQFAHVIKNVTLNDNKLQKDKEQKVKVTVNLNDPERFAKSAEQKFDTTIRTAAEETLTEKDVQKASANDAGEIKKSYEIRTIWTPNGVQHFNESFVIPFKPDVRLKSGFGHRSEIALFYDADTDQEAIKANAFSMRLPKVWVNGDREASDKDQIVTYAMDVTNDQVKATKADNRPNLPDLPNWQSIRYATPFEYPQVFAELRSGDLHTKDNLKQHPTKEPMTLDGNHRFYIPVWADTKKFDAQYQTVDADGNQAPLGVNKINLDLTRHFDIYAQMYSDASSETKGKDHFFIQPIYSDSTYSTLPKNLNGKDVQWATSVTDKSIVD